MPSITITPPASTTVTIGRDDFKSVKIDFTVANLTLSMNCGTSSTDNCGHIHVVIKDNMNTVICNDGSNPYNNTAVSTPAYGQFQKCPGSVTLGAAHTFVLEAHHDDHTPIAPGGTPVVDQISLTNVVDTSDPYLEISAPADGDTIKQNNNSSLNDVTFAVHNFTLMPPGNCGSAANCGHVHLLLVSAATGAPDCNDTAHSSPYNTAGQASPMRVNTTLCPTVSGLHDLVLELHKDDHSALIDSSNGLTVGTKVRVNVSP